MNRHRLFQTKEKKYRLRAKTPPRKNRDKKHVCGVEKWMRAFALIVVSYYMFLLTKLFWNRETQSEIINMEEM